MERYQKIGMREGIKETSEHAQFGSYILQGAGDMVGSRLCDQCPPKKLIHDLRIMSMAAYPHLSLLTGILLVGLKLGFINHAGEGGLHL
jgi:hypothetical protein